MSGGRPSVGFGQESRATTYAEVQILDSHSQRGVPLVELTTVNGMTFVTDNAGRIAIAEPGWEGQPIFFHVRSHGYEYPADGFGFRGATITIRPGEKTVLSIDRKNIAERMYRITGEGLYRDSILLGYSVPLRQPLIQGQVAGQDSAFSLPYQGKIYWFWGDTNRMRYPLGHYGMAGATSVPPDAGGLPIAAGIELNYFVDQEGFSRPVCRLGFEHGVVWSDAFTVLPDHHGEEQLACHYVHLASLDRPLGHGIAVFDPQREEFVVMRRWNMEDRWCVPPQSHPITMTEKERTWLLLGSVYPTVRVPATLEAFADPSSYEAWSCLQPGSTLATPQVDRDAQGRPVWKWRRGVPPVDAACERQLIDAGQLEQHEARGWPRDAATGRLVQLHRGSVHWNDFRKRWVMIATEQGGTSYLGEVWYGEALHPTGPWRTVVKIVTHDQYSFYNPVHHPHFDMQGGRIIFFEGTYTREFSGNDSPTPRYDYNQILYRLDLADARLQPAHGDAQDR